MLSDIEIAENAELKDIREVAAQLSLTEDELELYGKYKAKLSARRPAEEGEARSRDGDQPHGVGEGGETTVSIGLADGNEEAREKGLSSRSGSPLGPRVRNQRAEPRAAAMRRSCPCRLSTCTSRGICTRSPRRTISSARSWTIIFSAATS